ncbi:MAG: ATP-binding cassette domain-containing protein [Erysipelotrichaceae bacterium]|nr:ATP-binding cassette domain-containing protein [Erysipelotrichaceae bacterium]
MLDLFHISKTYDPGTINEKVLYSDFNFHVDQGDYITIVGANGSGKTTLFNLISGRLLPDEGTVLLDGRDVTFESEHIRAHEIGRLFQDPSMGTAPGLTVYENLVLAAKTGGWLSMPNSHDKEYLKQKLMDLDIGLEERMHQRVGTLSGGQRQALALVMATIHPPKLLLLDEHTAALDPQSAEKVTELTDQIIKENNITCLMITHDLDQALHTGNRTIMLNEGEIVYDVSGKEREKLEVNDLIRIFKEKTRKYLDDEVLLNV